MDTNVTHFCKNRSLIPHQLGKDKHPRDIERTLWSTIITSNNYYRRHTTTKTEVFASVRNSHRTLQLAVAKHSFQNADSRFFVNTIIFSNFLTLFTSCKHRYRYYVGIIQIFEQLRLSTFFQRVWNLKMLCASLEFRMISLMANFRSKQFICRSLLLS